MAAAHPLGIRESRARTLATTLVVALVLHLPFTPLPIVLRFLAAYLTRGDTSWDYQDDRVIIPISLVEDTSKTEEPPPPTSEAKSEPTPAPKPPKREPDNRGDAGAPDAATADAATADGGAVADARPPRPHREAGTRDAGVSMASAEGRDGGTGSGVKDTLSLVGGLRRAVQGKPNIALAIWFSTIHDHPLGPLVGSLLACNPQWKDFMGNLIDPLADLDGVLVTGPRFTETSKVIVYAQHRMEPDKVSEVMEALGARAKRQGTGGIIPTGHPGMQAVRFHADRADRVAFTHPRNMIMVTPPEGFEQLRDYAEPMSLPPAHGKALSLTLINPYRPLRAIGARLPETLTELRLHVTAANDGGVNVDFEFDDQDAAAAKAHAPDLTEQARALGGLFVSDIEFVAEENHLKGHTHLSRIAGTFVLGFVRGGLCPSGPLDGGTNPL